MSNIFDYFDDAISPIKRFPEIYGEHLQSSYDLMGGKGWRKPVGAAMYALSPVSAAYEAVRHEPIRDALMTAGMSPEKADQTAMYIGAALDVGVPVGMAMKGLNLPTDVAKTIGAVGSATEKTAGSAVMGATKVAQKAAPQTDIVTPVAKAVGENRLSATNQALAQWLNRRKGDFGGAAVGEKALPSWYDSWIAKFRQAPEMAKTAFKETRNVPGGRFGAITPKISGALDEVIDTLEKLPKKAGGGFKTHLADVYHGQIAYILSILEKYEPHAARTIRFRNTVGKNVFPESVNTTIHQMSKDPGVIFNLLKKYWGPDMNPTMIEKHLMPFIAKDIGLKGHNVHLSTKPFHQGRNPLSKMTTEGTATDQWNRWAKNTLFGFKGRLNYIPNVKKMVEGGVTSKGEIIDHLLSLNKGIRDKYPAALKAWRETKPEFSATKAYAGKMADWRTSKPKLKQYNRSDLERAIVDDGDYISVSQQFTSGDTLLATMPARMIISKSNPKDGALVFYDQMKQGTGFRARDFLLDLGSDINRIFIDVRPLVAGNTHLIENKVMDLLEQVPTRYKQKKGRVKEGEAPKLTDELMTEAASESNIHAPIVKRMDLARRGLDPEDYRKHELFPR